jgi:hypothetical protein
MMIEAVARKIITEAPTEKVEKLINDRKDIKFTMNFIGIDLHTNRFTCCYRTEQSKAGVRSGREMKTFDLTAEGLAAFYQTPHTPSRKRPKGRGIKPQKGYAL